MLRTPLQRAALALVLIAVLAAGLGGVLAASFGTRSVELGQYPAGSGAMPPPVMTAAPGVPAPTRTASANPAATAALPTRIPLIPPPTANPAPATAIAVATQPAPPSGGAPTPEPLARTGEFAYPQRMQVGRRVPVRLALYSEGHAPLGLPSAVSATLPVTIPQQANLEPWLEVTLEAPGVQVANGPEERLQPLYEANLWTWYLTANDANTPVTLRPHLRLEYHAADGTVCCRRDLPWEAAYTVGGVVGDDAVSVAGAWLGQNVLGLVGIIMGLPAFLTALRRQEARKPPAQETPPA